MKYCTNCGAQMNDTEMCCITCGALAPNPVADNIQTVEQTKQEPAVEAEKKYPELNQQTTQQKAAINKKPKRKGKVLLVLALALLLFAVIGAGIMAIKWYASPEQKILRALDAGDFDAALLIYENEMDGRNSDIFVDALTERIKTARDHFITESISYELAIKALLAIEKMNVSDVQMLILGTKEEIDSLNNSRIAFITAEKLISKNNYPEAISYYRQVIDVDANYQTAAKKLSDAENAYRQDVLNKAAEYAGKMQYSDAILELETGLQTLPNDKDILAQKKVYEADYVNQRCSEALTKAEEFEKTGDYANAIKAVQKALKDDIDNVRLKNAYQKYSDALVDAEIAKANNLIVEYNFDEAIKILKAALTIIPENKRLAEKLQLVETNKPVALTSIHVVDSLFYEAGSGSDTFGNSYDNAFSVGSYNLNCGYVIYNLNGKYDTFRFIIAASSSINGYTYSDPEEIKIYADDVLIFTKKLDMKTAPETVVLEIPDCKVLKIERGKARNLGNRLPLIADPVVFKVNME